MEINLSVGRMDDDAARKEAVEASALSEIPARVLDAVRARGYSDEEIIEMTPERIFEVFCNWEGLVQWGPTLYKIVLALESTK